MFTIVQKSVKNNKVKASVAQSCLTLCGPMNCSPPSSSVNRILQTRILEWVIIPLLQAIFPTQGSNPGLLNCRQTLYHLNHQEKNTCIKMCVLYHWIQTIQLIKSVISKTKFVTCQSVSSYTFLWHLYCGTSGSYEEKNADESCRPVITIELQPFQ